MIHRLCIVVGTTLIFVTLLVQAADLQAGKTLATNTCSACHGTNGIGIIDLYPNLRGQKAAYMVTQLKAFRDGSRNSAIMSPFVKSMSDRDFADVSAYYQSLSYGPDNGLSQPAVKEQE